MLRFFTLGYVQWGEETFLEKKSRLEDFFHCNPRLPCAQGDSMFVLDLDNHMLKKTSRLKKATQRGERALLVRRPGKAEKGCEESVGR